LPDSKPRNKWTNDIFDSWLYPETVHVLRQDVWKTCLSYKYGTEEELDQLELALQSGRKITALFCELPSNILLSSPNVRRVKDLADKFGFIVACDDTVAGFVNLDAIPYVDVMITSLTKTFSGSSNVTGGRLVSRPIRFDLNLLTVCSLIINPSSRHRDAIRAALSADYEQAFFPLDTLTLIDNCQNMPWRVKRCNENTLPLVDLLKAHQSIAAVHHPSIAPTSSIYKDLMRKDGGYGNVIGIVFHHPATAKYFYDVLDVCKGSSFGTNFTLVIPYVQLANYWDREKVPKYGLPQHIIRMSVGLEDSEQLCATVAKALRLVETFESQSVV
jgi:cystathionine gamma-synthase